MAAQTGIKSDLRAPGPIGSVTADSGAFTTLSATGNVVAGNSVNFANLLNHTGSGNTIQFPSDGVIGLYNNGSTGFSRLQFGGTTTSFPAIKRNGTGFDFRLADDSAYTDITPKTVKFPGSTSGTATVQAPAVAGTPTITLPSTTGTLALTGGGVIGTAVFNTGGASIDQAVYTGIIASASYDAVGSFVITFTVAEPDAGYIPIVTVDGASAVRVAYVPRDDRMAGGFVIKCKDETAAAADPQTVYVSIHRLSQ